MSPLKAWIPLLKCSLKENNIYCLELVTRFCKLPESLYLVQIACYTYPYVRTCTLKSLLCSADDLLRWIAAQVTSSMLRLTVRALV